MYSKSVSPWKGAFKDLDDQLNMYHQQWQADQQKQIIANMAGKMPGKSNNGKRKSNERNDHKNNGGRSGGRDGRGNINIDHLKTVECFDCGKKGHRSTDRTAPRMNENENSNMVPKSDFKNLFQSSLKDMLTQKEKQTKNKDNREV
jgi:hypothetical protein